MQRLQFLAGQYMGNPLVDQAVAPNVVFIRSLSADRDGSYKVDRWVSDIGAFLDASFAELLLDAVTKWTRTFYDIFVGLSHPAASEAFMYIVERISASPTAAGYVTGGYVRGTRGERENEQLSRHGGVGSHSLSNDCYYF